MCQAFTPQLLNDIQRKQSTTLLAGWVVDWLVCVCVQSAQEYLLESLERAFNARYLPCAMHF